MESNLSPALSSISKSRTVRDCVVDFADSHRLQRPMDECRSLADLPVLIQMALNISTIVTTLQSGQQISAAEAAAI